MSIGANVIWWVVGAFAILLSIIVSILFLKDRYVGYPKDHPLGSLIKVILLGGFCYILQHTMWRLIEHTFDWGYGAGGSRELPEGTSALLLSLTVSCPLVIAPYFARRLLPDGGLPANHLHGILYLVLGAAIAHLCMYGVSAISFPGLSQTVAPLDQRTELPEGLAREVVYAGTYMLLIVLPYRVRVQPPSSTLEVLRVIGFRVVLPAFVYVIVMMVLIIVGFPESLNDPLWEQVRGDRAAVVLMCSLCGGLFL